MRVTGVLGSKTLCFRRYTHHVMSVSDSMSASVFKSNEVLYLVFHPKLMGWIPIRSTDVV